MKLLYRTIVFCLFFAGLNSEFVPVHSQSRSMRQIERRSKRSQGLLNRTKSKKVLKAEKKAEAVKEKQKGEYNSKRKKALKRRKEIQTPLTQERMKATKKQAEDWNKKKRVPFLKRIFKRKPR